MWDPCPYAPLSVCYTDFDAFARFACSRGGSAAEPASPPPFLPAVFVSAKFRLKRGRRENTDVSECVTTGLPERIRIE